MTFEYFVIVWSSVTEMAFSHVGNTENKLAKDRFLLSDCYFIWIILSQYNKMYN